MQMDKPAQPQACPFIYQSAGLCLSFRWSDVSDPEWVMTPPPEGAQTTQHPSRKEQERIWLWGDADNPGSIQEQGRICAFLKNDEVGSVGNSIATSEG
jgi:hypothetical protein